MTMDPLITVYSKPACGGCVAVKRRLASQDLPFAEVDITKDPAALALVQGLGYSQAPVVVYQDGEEVRHFSGFNPEEMENLQSRMSPLLAA